MDGELRPLTEAGKRFVALAEEHATDFATRAEEHDRDGSFPFENIDALQKSGFMAGPVPAELGGIGVSSFHDMGIGVSRIARGCASTAIAANMHLTATAVMARMWRTRNEETPAAQTAVVEGFLKAIAAGQLITCVPSSETGTHLTEPMTEATRVEDGYVVNGRKIFGTLAPAAQILFSTARVKKDDGGYAAALVVVPKGAPGVEVVDNWDALGMRASGSGDVVYTDVKVPAGMIIIGGEWGEQAGPLQNAVAANASLVGSFLGVAEAARQIAVDTVSKQRKGASGKRLADRVPVQEVIAEIEIDLFTARAVVERVGLAADARGDEQLSEEEQEQLLKDHQSMKWVSQRCAINIVDKAMTLCGGAAFMRKHPLSRLYRDVRAGPFMQPYAPYEALEYIGKVTLGVGGKLDR